MTAHLSGIRATERRRELTDSFARMVDEAVQIGAAGMIIAGDLFDSDKLSGRIVESVLAVIVGAPRLNFFYLSGNHEKSSFLDKIGTKPKNLHIFDTGWTYYNIGEVTIAGRSSCSEDMFDTVSLQKHRKNIVVLHGELRERSALGEVIGARDAADKNIDYLALGHYHTYSQRKIDRRCTAVYSGTPEGRGFDEAGELGYVIIDTAGIPEHRFVPFAKRRMRVVDVDISGVHSQGECEFRVGLAVENIPNEDLVRITIAGMRDPGYICDTDSLYRRFSSRFYYLDIKDTSKVEIRAEDYRLDKSLTGEFVRLVMNEKGLDEEERDAILTCGLNALRGEAVYER